LNSFTGKFVPILATHDVGIVNTDVTSAIVAVHGLNENVIGTFTGVIASLRNRTDIIVIAPWFHRMPVLGNSWSPRCDLPESISWSKNSSWVGGGDNIHEYDNTTGAIGASSFSVLDSLYRTLSMKMFFPSLQRVTFTGFSAGGQMVNRYAWATKVGRRGHSNSSKTGLAVRFIVSDASSYLYLNSLRPAPSCTPLEDTGLLHKCEEFKWYTTIMP
jgi:hypothetical protein